MGLESLDRATPNKLHNSEKQDDLSMGKKISKSFSIDSSWLSEFEERYPKEAARFSRTMQNLLTTNYPLDRRSKLVQQKIETARKVSELTGNIAGLEEKRQELIDFMAYLEAKEKKETKEKKGGKKK